MESEKQSRDPVLRGHQSSFLPVVLLLQIRRRKSSTVPSWFALSARPSKALSASEMQVSQNWRESRAELTKTRGNSIHANDSWCLPAWARCKPEFQEAKGSVSFHCPLESSHFCRAVWLDVSQTEIANRIQRSSTKLEDETKLKKVESNLVFSLPTHTLLLHTSQSLFALILLSVYRDFFFCSRKCHLEASKLLRLIAADPFLS